MSLADELMADLEGSDEEEEAEVKENEEIDIINSSSPIFHMSFVIAICHRPHLGEGRGGGDGL